MVVDVLDVEVDDVDVVELVDVELVVVVLVDVELVDVVDVEVDGTIVDVVVVVLVVVVVVVVVVGGGTNNGPPQPHRMSIGAPIGVPKVAGIESRALRNWNQPSHAASPVEPQPAAFCAHAAVCTVKDAKRNGLPSVTARAASTAHWRACEPLKV